MITTHATIIGDLPTRITDMDLKDALDRYQRSAVEHVAATQALLAVMARYHADESNTPRGPIANLMRGKAHAVAETLLMDVHHNVQKTQMRVGDYQTVMGLD